MAADLTLPYKPLFRAVFCDLSFAIHKDPEQKKSCRIEK